MPDWCHNIFNSLLMMLAVMISLPRELRRHCMDRRTVEYRGQCSVFGRELRRWRGLRGISQLDLAVAIGTSPRHLSFVETGRASPGRTLVLRLAEALDVPIRSRNDLLTAAGY